MNFTFQYGDFYGSTTTLSMKDFITPFLTLSLFWLKIWYDKRKEDKDKKTDRMYKLEYFNSLIGNVVDTTTEQSKNLISYYNEIKEGDYDVEEFLIEEDSDLLRIVEFKQHSEYYRAYCDYFAPSKETAKQYNNIFKIITYLYKYNNEILQDIGNLRTKIDEGLKNFGKFDYEINEKLTRLRNELVQQEKSKHLIKKIFDEILPVKHNKFPQDLRVYRKERQDLIYKYLHNELKDYDNNDSIKNLISKQKVILDELIIYVQYFREKLFPKVDYYKQYTEELKIFYNELDKKLPNENKK